MEEGWLLPVRASKELSSGEKLLCIEIHCRVDEQGCCWTTNSEFVKFFETDKRTIQNWINSLEKKGFVERYFDKITNQRFLVPVIRTKKIAKDDRIEKFAKTFPNRSLNKITTLPEWFDVDLIIQAIQESKFLSEAENIGLKSCFENYEQYVSGHYKRISTPREERTPIKDAFERFNKN